ncbi:MAG: hypothetical protein ICV83_12090 [Cytophagales bacterium]|nr:hypothetical protein [Cytophagales bacterium]
MKTARKTVKDLVAKGTLGLAIVGMTSLYACQNNNSSEQSQSDAETADTAQMGGNPNAVDPATDAYGMDTNKGTANTRGMDELNTTHGTGASGSTSEGDTDTSAHSGGVSSQSGLKKQSQ